MIEISGKVVQGAKYGRVLGFPTANIDRRQYVRRKMKVRLGVWAGHAMVGQAIGRPPKRHRAAIVIGPFDSRHLPKIEAHLVGFKGNLYGKKITIILKKYMRPFKKFKSGIKNKIQIKKDIKSI